MAKVDETAALAELPLNDERRAEPKRNRHVVIALNHMNKRREILLEKRVCLTKEIDELDAAILALE
jgi:hypothetical protein